jgi:hypothetical protein
VQNVWGLKLREEASELLTQEETRSSEEISEAYYEEAEVEYIAFSPHELEQFLIRSETWDKITKGEISLDEAKSILEAPLRIASRKKVELSKGRKRRKGGSKSKT